MRDGCAQELAVPMQPDKERADNVLTPALAPARAAAATEASATTEDAARGGSAEGVCEAKGERREMGRAGGGWGKG